MNKYLRNSGAALLSTIAMTSIVPAEYDFSNIKAYAKEKGSVYLSSLSLSKSNIDFKEDVYYYTATVDRDANEIKVRAKPKSEDVSVSIDENYVDEGDNYKRVIELEDGSNLIKIKVTNSDNETKTYAINVMRGEGQKDEVYLEDLKINGQSINLSKDKTEYSAVVNEYTSEATINAVPEQDNYEVMIDGGNATNDNGFKQTVDLAVGENPIVINIKNKKSKDERQYILTIVRESELDNKQTQDDIYLDFIKIDDEKITLKKNQTDYNINLKENMEKVYITAEPEIMDYKVKINDKIVEESDDYKDFVTLKKGENQIKIVIQDLDNKKQRVYTLNINRGQVSQLNNNIEETQNISENLKINQWVRSSSGWSYNDAIGNPIKSTWFYDKVLGKEYYLKDDGIMATGWQCINDKWYYLNNNGAMQTGWFKDSNGKWYYLNLSGEMAVNTTVDGYKLGSDGAWKN